MGTGTGGSYMDDVYIIIGSVSGNQTVENIWTARYKPKAKLIVLI